ncbi:MAG: N-acetylmuramoyl-L-alanine amidase [Deltaproteobacteria bacterium]|nr:N-acetylmuramoyl-L-alanine amidase [Deltaproteobacteria bacterium]
MSARILRLCIALLLVLCAQPLFAQEKGEEFFEESLKLYKSLTADPVKINDEEIWDTIAKAFYSIYLTYPNSSKASNSLFLSGKMYEEMGNRFNSQDALKKSIERSREFIRRFPNSNLTDDAQIRIARIIEESDKSEGYLEYKKVIKDYPKGDMVFAATKRINELSAYKPLKQNTDIKRTQNKPTELVNIREIRHWSTENYTRVVIHVDKESLFTPFFLKADPILGKPPRLYVDIKGSRVSRDLKVEPIEKGLLEDIKFARNTTDQVRVVLYIKSFDDYRVFSLLDPFRIVMDIYGEKPKEGDVFVKQKSLGESKTPSTFPQLDYKNISNLRGALGLKVRTIVIDPGHGGHDPGATGPTGLKEKDVNLAIAKALKRKIEDNGGEFGVSHVVLTRSNDRFIPLEERTGIAKRERADLFVSIHCNAAKNNQAHGIETYILSFTNDPEALAVAARENSTTRKSLSDLEDIVKKYLLSSKIDESTRLATHVQSSVVNRIAKKFNPVKNKGVKKAPFIVLIGADVPSILVESSFITNPHEEKRLKSEDYINEIADGIFSGIKKYSNEVETAFLTE